MKGRFAFDNVFFMGEHKNHFSFAIKMSMQKEEEFAIAVVDRQDFILRLEPSSMNVMELKFHSKFPPI